MNLRLEMLQVARLAPKLLGDSAQLVEAFIRSEQNSDGGFKDRDGRSDLYYTVFALDGLLALQAEVPGESVASFLHQFGYGEKLDFIHLCCLARCWGTLQHATPIRCTPEIRQALVERLNLFRSRDGGFNPNSQAGVGGTGDPPVSSGHWPDEMGGTSALEKGARKNLPASPVPSGGSPLGTGQWPVLPTAATSEVGFNLLPQQATGSVYAAFLAAGAFGDLGAELQNPNSLVQSLKRLETSDGAWANDHHVKTGSTNATAAAAVLLTNLGMPLNVTVGDWLLARVHAEGGFVASPETPIPDLLSTATTLHALSCLQRDISGVRERCLDFVDSLWTNEGGFYGNWTEEKLDCEYTYYGLLALGHLSV